MMHLSEAILASDPIRNSLSLGNEYQIVGKMAEVTDILQQLKQTYLSDNRPWIVGFSGGKDSSCLAQLVFRMMLSLPPSDRKKEVHLISADTLVETPLIERRLTQVLAQMSSFVEKNDLPIKVHKLRPVLDETFWVNLIGRGYPSPNRWFRWCTDRLKIRPSSRYIAEQVRKNGEVTILLGARKSESASRAQTMGEHAIPELSMRRHTSIPGAYIYTPLEDLTTREVWAILLQMPPPWGGTNKELVTFYRKADGECPLVLDTTTPSCGGSRFGCWVCTVVDRDRSIEGLIEEGEEWLKPLLEFRNWLKEIRDDPSKREATRKSHKKRMIMAKKNGRDFKAPEHRGHVVLGPFTMETRHEILRRLLETQRKLGKEGARLISNEELVAIGALWNYEGDSPKVIQRICGNSVGEIRRESSSIVSCRSDDLGSLLEICERRETPLQLIERLLAVEKDFSGLSRRRDMNSRLERILEEHLLSELSAGGD